MAEISIPFPLIAAGEVHVASSLAAIIIAAVPLIGAVLALRFDHSERPTPVRAAGLAIGFAGVIALVGIDVAGNGAELLGARADPGGGGRLRDRADARQAPARRSGPARADGRQPGVAALILTPFAAVDTPVADADGGRVGGGRRARPVLHGGRRSSSSPC